MDKKALFEKIKSMQMRNRLKIIFKEDGFAGLIYFHQMVQHKQILLERISEKTVFEIIKQQNWGKRKNRDFIVQVISPLNVAEFVRKFDGEVESIEVL
ncbi:MAG: hypothetical protein ABIH48_01990 [Candidatus Falkowbacteria bacterium]